MGSLQAGGTLVIKGQQHRWLAVLAGVCAVRVARTCMGVIDQTEIRANVVFHHVFTIKES
jgi:hypothetical protein